MNKHWKWLAGAAILAAIHAGPAAADSKAEWEKTVAAAKKEGSVVISALSGELLRQVLLSFEQDYPGIKVKYTAGNLRDFWPVVYKEREVGQYLWDLRIGGVDAITYQAKDKGLLDPILPLLVLPDVVDDKKWMVKDGLKGLFGDNENKYVLHTTGLLAGELIVNRDSAPESQLKTAKDIIDPRWKGKIVMQDPRNGGSGTAGLATLMQLYGEPFVRDLLTKQDIMVSDNRRQMAEWVVRNRYPIAIGLGSAGPITQFQEQGLGKNIKPVPGYNAIAGNAVVLMNKAPNPNAAKVFLNWLLTRSTQQRFADISKTNSLRNDVKPGSPDFALDPQKAASYLDISDEKYAAVKLRAQEMSKELLSK
jgi:iron(III) transport system substrate-binding protein